MEGLYISGRGLHNYVHSYMVIMVRETSRVTMGH
jgi:hypothetical protein